ncbi:MAG: DUF420 domain-containing protein [Polyangiaceae bacterium]
MNAPEVQAPGEPREELGLYAVVAAVSAIALALLGYVLILRGRTSAGGAELAFMPALNAALNGAAAVSMTVGWFAIRAKRRALHRAAMLSAFGASALFFVSYLIYHYAHGDTRYPGTGLGRTLYLLLLGSHVIASIALVPLVLVTLYRAVRGRFARHRSIARIALPIWFYVSVTGIAVFFALRAATP